MHSDKVWRQERSPQAWETVQGSDTNRGPTAENNDTHHPIVTVETLNVSISNVYVKEFKSCQVPLGNQFP